MLAGGQLDNVAGSAGPLAGGYNQHYPVPRLRSSDRLYRSGAKAKLKLRLLLLGLDRRRFNLHLQSLNRARQERSHKFHFRPVSGPRDLNQAESRKSIKVSGHCFRRLGRIRSGNARSQLFYVRRFQRALASHCEHHFLLAPSSGCFLWQLIVDIVDPRNSQLLRLNKLDLFSQLINKSANGILHESHNVLRLARFIELAVVLSSCQVVVIAQKMCSRRGNSGFKQEFCFQKARGSAVTVPEGVNPREIEVAYDRLDKSVNHFLSLGDLNFVKPFAKEVQQKFAIFCRCSQVATHADRVFSDLSRNNRGILKIKFVENFFVESLDHFGCNRNWLSRLQAIQDSVKPSQYVCDLLLQVLPRRRKLEFVVKEGFNFLHRKCVAFNGSGRQKAAGEVHLMHPQRGLWLKRYTGNVVALGLGLAERDPEASRCPPKIEFKREPRMASFVFSCCHVRHYALEKALNQHILTTCFIEYYRIGIDNLSFCLPGGIVRPLIKEFRQMSILSAPYFHSEAAAYEFVEARLWPLGPICPKCGVIGNSAKMQAAKK